MNSPHDRILVCFNTNVPNQKCLQIHRQIGAKLLKEIPELNVHIISVKPDQTDKCLSDYSDCMDVKYAERDVIMKSHHLIPNDHLFNQQWGLIKIQAPDAWDKTRGSPNICVAILDTGIDQSHPDIAPKIVENVNFTNSPTVDDRFGHGTHMAGIVAAVTNNRMGVSGLAANSTIMNVKVIDDTGEGSTSSLSQGILFAANHHARVINMSLSNTKKSETLHMAIKYAAKKGLILVAAAGNSGQSQEQFPAAFSECISVAATKKDDKRANFSQFGASWVDVAAPGMSIMSTFPTHPNSIGIQNYGLLSGTSPATAFVSGLAGLILALNPKLNPSSVRKIIESTTDQVPGYGYYYKAGRINAYKAIRKASK